MNTKIVWVCLNLQNMSIRVCVRACKWTHHGNDYSSVLLGVSSTTFERSRLFELWSNNSVPLYKWIPHWHIYLYHKTPLVSYYLERVLEINPAVVSSAQTALKVMIISSCFRCINRSLWHSSDLVHLTSPRFQRRLLSALWWRVSCTLVVFVSRHAVLHLAGQPTAVWGS